MGQQFAETAEQLMRSRYSAFAVGEIDYIVATTVPAQQPLLDVPAIADWSKINRWLGLEVVKHLPKLGKRHAKVEFKAHYEDATGKHCHQELSSFVQINGRWFFLDPTVPNKLSMKADCLCGSGQKFKHCCAQYL
jgi:SEC-C motif-containing protein